MTLNPIFSISGFSEPFSSISHLLAAGIFLILGVRLILQNCGHAGRIICLAIFIFSAVFLLSMSGVFHLLEDGGDARIVLQRLDHVGIFLLIAGSFTAVHGLLFKGFWRWGMLTLVWAFAISGLTLKTIFFTSIPGWFGLLIYLGLGWLGAITAILLYRKYNFQFIKPLLYGAFAYTIGAIIELLQSPTPLQGIIGPHELFHIAVVLGLAQHFIFISRFSKHPEFVETFARKNAKR